MACFLQLRMKKEIQLPPISNNSKLWLLYIGMIKRDNNSIACQEKVCKWHGHYSEYVLTCQCSCCGRYV